MVVLWIFCASVYTGICTIQFNLEVGLSLWCITLSSKFVLFYSDRRLSTPRDISGFSSFASYSLLLFRRTSWRDLFNFFFLELKSYFVIHFLRNWFCYVIFLLINWWPFCIRRVLLAFIFFFGRSWFLSKLLSRLFSKGVGELAFSSILAIFWGLF